jgi:hypothetical protein
MVGGFALLKDVFKTDVSGSPATSTSGQGGS